MAKDHLNSNSANLTYSIREHSVCVDKGGTWPYTSLERNRCCQNLLLENSYHDNPGVFKELRLEKLAQLKKDWLEQQLLVANSVN